MAETVAAGAAKAQRISSRREVQHSSLPVELRSNLKNPWICCRRDNPEGRRDILRRGGIEELRVVEHIEPFKPQLQSRLFTERRDREVLDRGEVPVVRAETRLRVAREIAELSASRRRICGRIKPKEIVRARVELAGLYAGRICALSARADICDVIGGTRSYMASLSGSSRFRSPANRPRPRSEANWRC